MAMREWRAEVEKKGFNLMDGPNLFDLRIADDILILAHSRVEAGNLLDALVEQLDRVGFPVNPEKTMVIMNEAQPPRTITTTAGAILRVLPRDDGQRWLGSILTSRGSRMWICNIIVTTHPRASI